MNIFKSPVNLAALALFALMFMTATGCKQNPGAAASQPPPAAEVGVVTAQATSVPFTTELPGRVTSVRMAEVRARVAGILLKQNFKQGSDVKEGDKLFEIDPAQYQANYDSAKASLTKAEANVKQAQAKTDRYQKLVEFNAVSKQDYDSALATSLQADADVLTAKASLETAALNLGYTKVIAPISGRIGTAKVTEGALVGQNETTLLAVIQQMDPIYVDVTQSSGELFRIKNEFGSDPYRTGSAEPKATLILENGREYREPGKILASEVTVDPTTGSVTRRALFPNPNGNLLPGMFVRARILEGVQTNVFLIPQVAVNRDSRGIATVFVVNSTNQAEPRVVTADQSFGDQWTINAGLKEGDKIIVTGMQQLRPGVEVKPISSAASKSAASVLSAAQ